MFLGGKITNFLPYPNFLCNILVVLPIYKSNHSPETGDWFVVFIVAYCKVRNLFHIGHQLFRLHLHFREGEPLLAEVFQRGTDMVDCVVDAEETVVDFIKSLHLDGLILGIVLSKVIKVANCDLEELVVGTKVTFCDLEGLSPLSKVTISLSC